MNPCHAAARCASTRATRSLLGRGAGHANMRAQLQEARWLLKSLEIRHDTLLKVARSIVERQSAFLEQGEEHMRPMILRDIADAIGMHESTISRVTSGKYMHTPRGVFELRYFFSSQVESADGSGTSSTAIRAKIRKLIRDEAADAPAERQPHRRAAVRRRHPGRATHGCQVSRSHGHRAVERTAAGSPRTDSIKERHHAPETHRPPRRSHPVAARLRREEAGAHHAALRPGHRRAAAR